MTEHPPCGLCQAQVPLQVLIAHGPGMVLGLCRPCTTQVYSILRKLVHPEVA